MDFRSYQIKSRRTAIYPNKGKNIVYPTLGLTGESGEIAEKIKKVLRGDRKIDKSFKSDISKELGDVLWYVAQISTELGLNLSDIALQNIEKLTSRKKRNVLKGEGDNR